MIRDAVIDLRYATADNFTGKELYPVARCKLRRAVAARLARAAKALRAQDRRLVLWDCYRPASIQKELWRRCRGSSRPSRSASPPSHRSSAPCGE